MRNSKKFELEFALFLVIVLPLAFLLEIYANLSNTVRINPVTTFILSRAAANIFTCCRI
jgi:hypothetical protein